MNHLILIVDDIEQNIILLRQILEMKNYKVICASSSKEALSILDSVEPDLILLDVIMPEINGFDLCKILKTKDNTKDIPVIFLSALSELGTKLEGLKLGAVDYITKPYDSDEVIERVRIHIKIRDLEKQNYKMIELLQKSSFEKEKLFQVITHDLKSPLTSIILYSEMMRDNTEKLTTEKIIKFSSSIHDSSKKILEMIQELARLSKFESQVNLNEIVEINLYDFLQNTIHLFLSQAEKKNITIKLIAEDKNMIAKLDERKLFHILNNLLSNSIKFSNQNGLIEIDYFIYTSKLIIKVKDYGIGIPESFMKYLFDKYSESHRIGTEGEEGTGLGMYITKDFVESMKGQIYIFSKVGEGTTVNLEFDNF